jgi:FKBP-type peptidyl-prolyl cis-trans isomerase FkpA
MKYTYIILFAMFLFGCGEEVADLTTEEYIAVNNLTTKELDKGVHIVIVEAGNNKKPNINSKVKVNYEGRLTNDVLFDSGSNVEFQLAGLIEGWRIGLKEIGEGGSCKLIIPPNAGYGGNANGIIPANSVLIFDMDLIEVK